ncbi:hypothetical protein F2Q68_00041196 [Brassica cretica]|uniref:RRM domain-containing protein n=1 Tax=Brassica cretica TaxID=69181 RepID=A0A8S9MC43_BRACR|nr:hypothetical protein F2Q68_00041196 [Brassica cretica]
MSGRFSRSIYVGNLPGDIRESEIEDLFYKYGRIVDIELKVPPRPPCYCFVEFEHTRDAEDAIDGRDGYNFDGCRLRVELAHGGRGQSSGDRRGGGGYRGGGGGYGSGGGGGGGGGSARFGVSRHSEFRVIVRGLPSSASWQDLKVTKYESSQSRSPSRSRSRSRGRGRSPSRSPSRSVSRSRSPRKDLSKSPRRSLSRSVSKSRSPSPDRKKSPPRAMSRSRSRSLSKSPAKVREGSE